MEEKNYVTKEEFKEKLKEIVESGKSVWCFLGALSTMVGCFGDQETKDLMYQLIDNDSKKIL